MSWAIFQFGGRFRFPSSGGGGGRGANVSADVCIMDDVESGTSNRGLGCEGTA